MDPPAARKLIEGAVQYARGLGFSPRGDYHKATAILGDVDPSQCSEEFGYGLDGKPKFINGPHDTPEECERICKTLELHCGPGGYETIFRIL